MNRPLNNLLDLLERYHDPNICRLLYEILRLHRQDTPTSRAQLKIVLMQAAEAVHTGEPLHHAEALNNDFQAFNDSLTLDYMAGALP